MDKNTYDVIIFGAGLSGLVTAYTLSSFGIKCCLLEKSDHIGGGNTSFKNDLGDVFDTGYHALDESRSKITSSLFKKVMPNYCTHTLSRGIALGGHVIKYNANSESWPSSLLNKLDMQAVDDIDGEVTVDKLSAIYGNEFIKFCEDSVFSSYPSEVRAQNEGRTVLRKFDQIYPWFFPKLDKVNDGESESTRYHNKMRNAEQKIIYPKKLGFFGFIEGLYNAIKQTSCDVMTGCTDLDILIDENLQCTGVEFSNKKYTADHYFWCAPFFGLAALYKIPLPKGVPQKLVLGSFRFDDELSSDFHEILVGDNQHKINRISYPALLRDEPNNLLQVEFMYPADEYNEDADCWKKSWVDSLIVLGLIDKYSEYNFHFKEEFKGMVTEKPLDEISVEYERKLDESGGNIFVPFVNAGPENINRLVPSVIKNTIDFISNKGL